MQHLAGTCLYSFSCAPPATRTLLVVDDESSARGFVAEAAKDIGLQVICASNTEKSLDLLAGSPVDLILTDLRVPQMGGIDLIRKVRKKHPRPRIAVLTGYGTIDTAVESIRLGASTYLQKPVTLDNLQDALRLMIRELKKIEGDEPTEAHWDGPAITGMIGQSVKMKDVYRLIERVRDLSCPVLICGETGVGKELVARAIHTTGGRGKKPFVQVDCAVLTPTLFESELFGHLKGAFTGAEMDKQGLLQSAMDGTVFFDEIGEVPIEMQAKLLRVLQERRLRPIGSTATVNFEARPIFATNRNLGREVAASRFRLDLFYRLNVVQINLPALRERKEDIPLLAQEFLKKHREPGKDARLSKEAMDELLSHDWPGNVRELENVIERALALSSESVLEPRDMVPSQLHKEGYQFSHPTDSLNLNEIEQRAVVQALSETHGDKILAAQRLGIGKTTLYRWLKKSSLGA